jgi:hypothetical protein
MESRMSDPAACRTRNSSKWPLRLIRCGTVWAIWALWAAPAWAQAPGGRVVGGGKSYVIEGVVTVLLFGLAIFAVGRTGRRN